MYGAASLIVTAILLPFIGSVSVCLRFYVRLRLKPTFIGIDDWLILFSCILVWAQGANQVVAASIGDLGRDNKDTVEWRVKVAQKAAHANLIIEKVTYTTIKLSVLLFYRRIFLHQKKFRIANDILIILVTLWGFVFLLTFAFLAGDVNSPGENWGSLWFCITEVVSDVAILALPYPCIRELQMSKRDKMGVIAIFLLGTLSLIFGIIRLGFSAKAFYMYFHLPPSEKNSNPIPPWFWGTVEISIGLLAACLPPMGTLIRRTPSPSELFASMRRRVSLRFSRGSRPSKGLSSDQHASKIDGFNNNREATDDVNEMADF